MEAAPCCFISPPVEHSHSDLASCILLGNGASVFHWLSLGNSRSAPELTGCGSIPVIPSLPYLMRTASYCTPAFCSYI